MFHVRTISLAAVLIATGCGEESDPNQRIVFPDKSSVTFHGKVIPDGTGRLHPATNPGDGKPVYVPRGRADESGNTRSSPTAKVMVLRPANISCHSAGRVRSTVSARNRKTCCVNGCRAGSLSRARQVFASSSKKEKTNFHPFPFSHHNRFSVSLLRDSSHRVKEQPRCLHV